MYCEYFGFAELPFSVTSDPQSFYINAASEEMLTTLAREMERGNVFVVVTGDAGTGKTTLLRRLIGGLPDKIDCTLIIVNARLSFITLLRRTLKELGVSGTSTDRESLLEQLDNYLQVQFAKDRSVTLIFDEAQAMSDEVLKEIPSLCDSDSKIPISIVLMGQPDLERRLSDSDLRSLTKQITLTRRLTPLENDDVGPYITSKLEQAGYKGDGLFEPAAVERIVNWSNGIPRLINTVCDNALLFAYRASARKVTAEIIEQVAGDLRLGDRAASADQNTPAELAQLRNLERAFSVKSVEANEAVPDSEQIDEGPPIPPVHQMEPTVRQINQFTNLNRIRLLVGTLMLVVVSAWTVVVFYPRQRIATPSVNKVVESSRMAYAPAEPLRLENKSIVKEPLQPASAPLPASTVVQQDEIHNDTVVVKAQNRAEVANLGKLARPASQQIYRVNGPSFLRNRPTANAEIVDTLQPGIRIAIISRSGEYFRVRSLGDANVFGFVHKEDAFFERIQ